MNKNLSLSPDVFYISTILASDDFTADHKYFYKKFIVKLVTDGIILFCVLYRNVKIME